jgi:hypothetical protein
MLKAMGEFALYLLPVTLLLYAVGQLVGVL